MSASEMENATADMLTAVGSKLADDLPLPYSLIVHAAVDFGAYLLHQGVKDPAAMLRSDALKAALALVMQQEDEAALTAKFGPPTPGE